jgi:parallel beta-helix repeat protein
LTLGLGLALAVTGLLSGGAPRVTLAQSGSGVIRVALTGEDVPGCGSAVSPCRTVQFAVDQALPGEEIRVAAGVYSGVDVRARDDVTTSGVVTQLLYISKSITIRGGYTTADWDSPDPAAHPTALDAQGQGRVLYITGDITATIEGLRITGGDASGLGGNPWGDNVGGGVYAYTATTIISGNVIFGNTAGGGNSFGGGLATYGGDSRLQGNDISGNSAKHGAGAYWRRCSSAILSNNTVSGNVGSGWGGGLHLSRSDATLEGNTISGNTGGYGGGVNVERGSVVLNSNLIHSNTGGWGGGLFSYICDLTMRDDIVRGNSVTADLGGGVYLYEESPVLVNTVIADNTVDGATGLGAAIYVLSSSPSLLHTTIARNGAGSPASAANASGGGVYVTGHEWSGDYYPSTVSMTNTILVSHNVGISVTGGNTVTVNGVLWHDTPIPVSASPMAAVSVQHQHAGDPAFAPDGYHLTGSSAAINTGVDAGVTTDIDGEGRPQGSGYDIGADEILLRMTYLPLVMRNRSSR